MDELKEYLTQQNYLARKECRSSDVVQIAEAMNDVNNLIKENTQLKARNARLEDFISELNKSLRGNAVINYGLDYGLMLSESNQLLNETPQQSLNEIKAELIPNKVTVSQVVHSKYAQGWNDCVEQLRNSVKDSSDG